MFIYLTSTITTTFQPSPFRGIQEKCIILYYIFMETYKLSVLGVPNCSLKMSRDVAGQVCFPTN
jgi:hypothetical protein